MLQRCATVIVENLDSVFVQIWTRNESQNRLELAASGGLDARQDNSATKPKAVATELLSDAHAATVSAVPTLQGSPAGARVAELWQANTQTADECRISFAGEPLLVNGRLVGALALFSRQPLSEFARKALGTVSDSIALGIERYRMESVIQEIEERFQAVIEFAADAMVITDATGHIALVNAAAERLFGYERSEMLNEPIEFLIPARLRESHVASRNQYLKMPYSRAMQDTSNLLVLCKDGSECPVEISLSPIKTDRLTLYAASIRDITERKQAEEERTRLLATVEHQHAELQMILDSVPALIFYKDRQSRLVRVNAAHAQCFGLPREQIEGKTDAELGAPHASEYLRDDLQVITTGEPLRGIVEQFQTPAGPRWLQTEKMPHRDSHGNIVGLVGLAVDITERKNLEEQLRQAQKLESIGRLAGGVAHDFNNLLTVINGYSELLLEKMEVTDLQRPLLKEIRDAGERAAGLTHQLLAFSRKQVLEPRVLNLNQQVANLEKMLRRLIGENIRLRTKLEPQLWPVLADVGQLEQVIMNLVINARDAMSDGGDLLIQTANVDVRVRDVSHPAEVSPGNYIVLSVVDTGCGMDEATRARIFEPFFTTKEEGRGTGLGLAVVYGIVKQSSGHIAVQTERGQGTTFSIYLPWTQQSEPVAVPHQVVQRFPPGTETILLVEDEPIVRQLASRALHTCGYTVLEAANGREGLRVSATHPGAIHLLVTDLIMPVLCGRKLAEQLVQERPTVKVLYVSGYTADAISQHDIAAPGTAFLQKPFTPTTLTQKVREVLDLLIPHLNESV
ncbi:MAG: PAS/PAC sensor hybrid histidine kinase [Planctomycetota bacterium]|nr:MAG: PAS/PAC sensor hybrid histidine kinase [Planctomycetota bacterium]